MYLAQRRIQEFSCEPNFGGGAPRAPLLLPAPLMLTWDISPVGGDERRQCVVRVEEDARRAMETERRRLYVGASRCGAGL